MVTKLIAADLATAVGCSTIITLGSSPQNVIKIIKEIDNHSPGSPFNPTMGTHFLAKPNPMVDRKWWILHGLATYGSIFVDAGAVRAFFNHKSSLFAAGIVKVQGSFVAQQSVKIVTIVNISGREGETVDLIDCAISELDQSKFRLVEIGKGLVNYSASEIQRIKGCKSRDIEQLLGYMDSDCVVHRDNLVVTIKDIDVNRIAITKSSK